MRTPATDAHLPHACAPAWPPERVRACARSGLTVWDSSIVLAKYLEREGHSAGRRGGLLRGKVVLELGSGAGLVGLTALHLGAKKVYCTEYSRDLPVLRALEANITAAHNLGDAPAGAICMRTLDWGEPLPEWFRREVIDQDGVRARSPAAARACVRACIAARLCAATVMATVACAACMIRSPQGLDVILGADVVYSEEDGEDDTMTKLLLSTVKDIFSACRDKPSIASRRSGSAGGPSPELVVGYEETTARASLPLSTFWSGLKGRCVYNEVSQPELHPGYR